MSQTLLPAAAQIIPIPSSDGSYTHQVRLWRDGTAICTSPQCRATRARPCHAVRTVLADRLSAIAAQTASELRQAEQLRYNPLLRTDTLFAGTVAQMDLHWEAENRALEVAADRGDIEIETLDLPGEETPDPLDFREVRLHPDVLEKYRELAL